MYLVHGKSSMIMMRATDIEVYISYNIVSVILNYESILSVIMKSNKIGECYLSVVLNAKCIICSIKCIPVLWCILSIACVIWSMLYAKINSLIVVFYYPIETITCLNCDIRPLVCCWITTICTETKVLNRSILLILTCSYEKLYMVADIDRIV